MTYPQFFNNIPTIKLQDDLASLLGAFEDGLIEYSYLDSVKRKLYEYDLPNDTIVEWKK